ncbi:MAG: hypothetical protein AUK47_00615 [Deltaproteobacteria bacterium CG2_30_63_29]|nr:MAG: hypothetical protein AUK47_00615 [Deltaproteobacteria bacterium CG2_30_63_29]
MDDQQAPSAKSFWHDLLVLPNLLCLYRIFGVMAALSVFYLGYPSIGLAIGCTAGLTDYFDGYYARKLGLVTELGALLDTLADLLFNFLTLIVAVDLGVWPVYLLVLWGLRDLTVLALRASAGQQGFTIPSIFLGKLASNFIFYSLVLMGLTYIEPFGPGHFMTTSIYWLGMFGIHSGILMQWLTAAVYLRTYAMKYQSEHENKKGKQNASATDSD